MHLNDIFLNPQEQEAQTISFFNMDPDTGHNSTQIFLLNAHFTSNHYRHFIQIQNSHISQVIKSNYIKQLTATYFFLLFKC
jgi:hypothetical protein